MNRIQLKARAKINLALDVLNRREDGYHNLRMIMQTVNLYDHILIKKIRKQGIMVKTNLPFIPTDQNNLVYKAADLIKQKFDIESGLFINLHKVIPVAAGLAGGSSDAAAVLMGLNRLFDLGLSLNELMTIGLSIGADVPYCLLRGTALAEGIGEKITNLPPLPKCYILLAKPNISVSTAFVYNHLDINQIEEHPKVDQMIDAINNQDLPNVAKLLGNVLETVTIEEYPVIEEIKKKMLENGALGSIMSGSGPTVFGIFADIGQAKKALYQLKISSIVKQAFLTNVFNRKGAGC